MQTSRPVPIQILLHQQNSAPSTVLPQTKARERVREASTGEGGTTEANVEKLRSRISHFETKLDKYRLRHEKYHRKLLQAEASRTPRNVLTRLRAIQKIVEARRSLTSPLIPPSKSLPSNCSSDPLPQFIPLHVPKEDDTKPGQKVEPLVVPTQLKPEAKREAIAAPSRPPGASLASPPMSPPHLLVPRPAQCSSETPRGVNKWCWCGYCRSPVSNWAEHLSTERHIAAVNRKGAIPCMNWKRGACFFGKRCHFLHAEPSSAIVIRHGDVPSRTASNDNHDIEWQPYPRRNIFPVSARRCVRSPSPVRVCSPPHRSRSRSPRRYSKFSPPARKRSPDGHDSRTPPFPARTARRYSRSSSPRRSLSYSPRRCSPARPSDFSQRESRKRSASPSRCSPSPPAKRYRTKRRSPSPVRRRSRSRSLSCSRSRSSSSRSCSRSSSPSHSRSLRREYRRTTASPSKSSRSRSCSRSRSRSRSLAPDFNLSVGYSPYHSPCNSPERRT